MPVNLNNFVFNVCNILEKTLYYLMMSWHPYESDKNWKLSYKTHWNTKFLLKKLDKTPILNHECVHNCDKFTTEIITSLITFLVDNSKKKANHSNSSLLYAENLIGMNCF